MGSQRVRHDWPTKHSTQHFQNQQNRDSWSYCIPVAEPRRFGPALNSLFFFFYQINVSEHSGKSMEARREKRSLYLTTFQRILVKGFNMACFPNPRPLKESCILWYYLLPSAKSGLFAHSVLPWMSQPFLSFPFPKQPWSPITHGLQGEREYFFWEKVLKC